MQLADTAAVLEQQERGWEAEDRDRMCVLRGGQCWKCVVELKGRLKGQEQVNGALWEGEDSDGQQCALSPQSCSSQHPLLLWEVEGAVSSQLSETCFCLSAILLSRVGMGKVRMLGEHPGVL